MQFHPSYDYSDFVEGLRPKVNDDGTMGFELQDYQIGASYFLKLRTLTFDQLWTDYLQPLLQEYVQGMYDEGSIMNRFAKAYGYKKPSEGDADESAKD